MFVCYIYYGVYQTTYGTYVFYLCRETRPFEASF